MVICRDTDKQPNSRHKMIGQKHPALAGSLVHCWNPLSGGGLAAIAKLACHHTTDQTQCEWKWAFGFEVYHRLESGFTALVETQGIQ